ncbi:hypothetical protein VTL71DRAFT_3022 [Oculimacula yallundae]|uniref:Cytochrome P450 n=1 Tax=Oculimacula yallundae TaxID=86028 RepID=A0ABR4C6U0_9HELO
MLSTSEFKIWNIAHADSALIASVVAAAIVAYLVHLYSLRQTNKTGVPFYKEGDSAYFQLKKRWMFDSMNLIREAYHKFYDQPFKVWTTEGIQMSLPAKYIDEVKMLPDHTFPSSLREFMQASYTMAPSDPQNLDYVNAVLFSDLNRNMGIDISSPTEFPKKSFPNVQIASVFPCLQEEIDDGIPAEFPECEDWTPITLYDTVLRLVCRVSGKVFVGPGLNRNAEWIDISCGWTRNIFVSAVKLKMLPAFLRPLGSYFIPEIKRSLEQNARARELITPIVQQREREESTPGYEKPNDAIEWLRDALPNRKDYTFHGIGQLAIGAVSNHTVTHLTTNTLFNLAAYPEYCPILRQEIDEILIESGGKFTLDSMSKMQKLDSFLNETLRCNTPSIVTFQRKAIRQITLRDGTTISAGTLIFSPANAISSDDSLYPDADKFDGLRFYKLRQANPEKSSRYQLTSISKTQMNFGAGRHACPGRWLASHEIKLIIASFLARYDLKLKDGEGRPKSINFQHANAPDPKAQILFRRRVQ